MLHRVAHVEIPLVFRMVEWAIVGGVAKYLAERFQLEILHGAALLLAVLMLAQPLVSRRSLLAKATFVLLTLALIALAWETASLIATLQATVIAD